MLQFIFLEQIFHMDNWMWEYQLLQQYVKDWRFLYAMKIKIIQISLQINVVYRKVFQNINKILSLHTIFLSYISYLI